MVLFVALAVLFGVVTLAVPGVAPFASAIGSPFGYTRCESYTLSATTGGASGVTVTPTTNAELITYLSDSTALCSIYEALMPLLTI
ncbi:hypothetical protein PIIN_04301 [Serendipita indica DSM 11827]|uniref:Uncharacterized protein n=1 Tax=Serendipita indica (strain DSM 11827) TaxID=1109443 RepID=G4TGD2_SERID|nr:hypothetical protein PIIN_04301 [Serendipita indica DSM 11827]